MIHQEQEIEVPPLSMSQTHSNDHYHVNHDNDADAVVVAVKHPTGRINLKRQTASKTRKPDGFRVAMHLSGGMFVVGLLSFPIYVFLPMPLFGIAMLVNLAMLLGGAMGLLTTAIVRYTVNQNSSSRLPMPTGNDVEAIGLLLDRLSTDVQNTNLILLRLTKIMPCLNPDSAYLLSTRHYKRLNQMLRHYAFDAYNPGSWEVKFVSGLLDAYSQMGDPAAIRSVEHLSKGLCAGKRPNNDVTRAALRCLPHLKAAAELSKHQSTLLRASQQAEPAGELMRASISTPETEISQLMRSASAGPNDSLQ